MYCNNCHHQCPDNFSSCPYCAAPLKTEKKKKPEVFQLQKKKKFNLSFKMKIITVVSFAFILCVVAIIVGVSNGSKPEKVVKTMVQSIENKDAKLYYSIYDEQIRDYNKENWYFDDDETFAAMTEPLEKKIEFYGEKCGKDFKLQYTINSVTYIEGESFNSYCEILEESFGYRKLPTDIAEMNFVISVKGSDGTYSSVYDSFLCMKIGGKWYRVYSSVFNEN